VELHCDYDLMPLILVLVIGWSIKSLSVARHIFDEALDRADPGGGIGFFTVIGLSGERSHRSAVALRRYPTVSRRRFA
jgi:hypothetical protein